VWVAGTATGSSFSTLLLPLGQNIDPACHYCVFFLFLLSFVIVVFNIPTKLIFDDVNVHLRD
jgi:hypothetical protein